MIKHLDNRKKILEYFRYLLKNNIRIKNDFRSFYKNKPYNIIGHIAFSLGYGNKEITGHSIYDFISYNTKWSLKDISMISKSLSVKEAIKNIECKI